MTVFENVKRLCDERRISINDLEKSLGYSKNTLYRLKTQNPGADKLQSIADYFKVSTDYILGRTAFKKPTELFEHWNGHNNPYFESPFDFGGLLKKIREDQDILQQEVSEALGITESDVSDIENGDLPLNYEWAEKYAKFLDTSVEEIFIDNNMSDALNDIPLNLLRHYQEQGLSETEMAKAYAQQREAEYHDAVTDPDHKKFSHSLKHGTQTIAAHHDGEEWTEEELEEIERFKEYVRMRRKMQQDKE